jgi:hypothetical protein
MPPALFCFFLLWDRVSQTLPGPASNFSFSCVYLPSSWNYRCVPQCPVRIFLLKSKSWEFKWHLFFHSLKKLAALPFRAKTPFPRPHPLHDTTYFKFQLQGTRPLISSKLLYSHLYFRSQCKYFTGFSLFYRKANN